VQKIKNKIKDCDSKSKKAKLKDELSEANDDTKALQIQLNEIKKEYFRGCYKAKKEYFEKFHFKVMDPICYARKRYTDFQLYNKSGYMEVYEYLKIIKVMKGVEVEVSFIKEWLSDIDILEYNKVDFLPPPLAIPEDTHNLFCGLAAENYINETTTENYDIFLKHLEILAGDEKAIKGIDPLDYLIKYLADMVQNPGIKPGVSLTFAGIQGTGKSLFWGEFGRKILGDEYTLQTARIKDLIGTFSKVNHKILVIAEETDCGDTFKNGGLLKDLTTCEYGMYEEKHKSALLQRSVLRLLKLTNQSTINVEMNDRRECILKPLTTQVVNLASNDEEKEKRVQYFTDLADAFNDKGRCYAFYNFLKNVPLNDFNVVKDRPLTNSYYDMQSVNISIYKRFLNWRCSMGQLGQCEFIEHENDELDKGIESFCKKKESKKKDKKETLQSFDISAYNLYNEFQEWIAQNKPKCKENISSTSMGRWLGKYHPITRKRIDNGTKVIYTIDPQKVRDDCAPYNDFLY